MEAATLSVNPIFIGAWRFMAILPLAKTSELKCVTFHPGFAYSLSTRQEFCFSAKRELLGWVLIHAGKDDDSIAAWNSHLQKLSKEERAKNSEAIVGMAYCTQAFHDYDDQGQGHFIIEVDYKSTIRFNEPIPVKKKSRRSCWNARTAEELQAFSTARKIAMSYLQQQEAEEFTSMTVSCLDDSALVVVQWLDVKTLPTWCRKKEGRYDAMLELVESIHEFYGASEILLCWQYEWQDNAPLKNCKLRLRSELWLEEIYNRKLETQAK